MMNERGKSDPAVVAAKLANKAEQSAAEPVEPRAGTKGNANQQHSGRTQSRETVSQVLARIRQTARNSDLPSLTRGRSRMRESRTYGSVWGAGSNLRPYRDRSSRRRRKSGCWGAAAVANSEPPPASPAARPQSKFTGVAARGLNPPGRREMNRPARGRVAPAAG
jgi:hypothetical protein